MADEFDPLKKPVPQAYVDVYGERAMFVKISRCFCNQKI